MLVSNVKVHPENHAGKRVWPSDLVLNQSDRGGTDGFSSRPKELCVMTPSCSHLAPSTRSSRCGACLKRQGPPENHAGKRVWPSDLVLNQSDRGGTDGFSLAGLRNCV
jgi:hypothetical protein